MQDADKGQRGRARRPDLRIGIVQARFNDAITDTLAEACLAELRALGVAAKHIRHVTRAGRAGSAARAAGDGRERATSTRWSRSAASSAARPTTSSWCANESGAGVTRVSLDHQIPIANAILTVENEAQAWARAEEKGRDAARVAVEMANLMEDLS